MTVLLSLAAGGAGGVVPRPERRHPAPMTSGPQDLPSNGRATGGGNAASIGAARREATGVIQADFRGPHGGSRVRPGR